MADVSVIIPTYNGESFVEEALRSVEWQTDHPSEVIVVDDHSTDRTLERVERLSAGLSFPVQTIRLDKNSGSPARPLNIGIRAARGKFIAVLDQDDQFLPHVLRLHASILDRHAEASFVFSLCGRLGKPLGCNRRQRSKLVRELKGSMERREGYYISDGDYMFRQLIRHQMFIVGYPGFMFRKSAWDRVGGIDESFRVASDLDLACSLSHVGSVAFVNQVGYLRREHSKNLSTRNLTSRLDRIRIFSKYLTAAEPEGEGISRPDSLLNEKIRWHLDKLARSLWAGNCPVQAQEVYAMARPGRSARRRLNQQLQCAAYKVCCTLLNWHWSISDSEAAESVEIARDTVALLEQHSGLRPHLAKTTDRRLLTATAAKFVKASAASNAK